METQPIQMITPEPNGQIPYWIRFIYSFGIPAALSVYLIWLLAARIEGKMDLMQDQLEDHMADSSFNTKSNEVQMRQLSEIYIILQRICVNAAETTVDRTACFERGIK